MLVPIFDLDGTLLDSDAALTGAFVALGVPREAVTFGHVLADECARLGLRLEAYLDAYDHSAALPFPGIEEMLAALERWGLCSNKHSSSGRRELARLGWQPAVALFSEDFGGPTGPARPTPAWPSRRRWGADVLCEPRYGFRDAIRKEPIPPSSAVFPVPARSSLPDLHIQL